MGRYSFGDKNESFEKSSKRVSRKELFSKLLFLSPDEYLERSFFQNFYFCLQTSISKGAFFKTFIFVSKRVSRKELLSKLLFFLQTSISKGAFIKTFIFSPNEYLE